MNTNPKSTPSLVLGIISIVFCWVPIVGSVLGILAIVFANQSKKLIASNPELISTKGATTGGLVCGIIGTSLSGFYLIYWVLIALVFGAVASAGGFH